MTDNNGSSEHSDKRFQDGKQRKATVYLELSDKLKDRATVEKIGIYRRANIVVTLNHGCKKTVISSISPLWTKTISEFEKQAKRKNLSIEETIEITDFLDNNHERILEILDAESRDDLVDDNDLNRTKEKQRILTEIEESRTANKNMILEEWQEKLVGKYDHLQETVNRNLPSIWPALEFELSILKVLNIKDCTLPFAGIILGVPSSLKTQCIELLRSWPKTFYTDNFSAKSFVSHTTAVPKEMLTEIDLLPKIKNKCFLTPELAPTFAAKDDDLIQILGIMTRILDGNGYESDSGVNYEQFLQASRKNLRRN